ITAGGTLDLGTKYANPYGSTITITGTIRNSSGAPLAGRYVRAHTEPCLQGGIDYGPNQCGPVKFLALQPTDANGRYTIVLRDPGTYYVSTFSSWDTSPGCSGYCAAPIIGTGYPQPVSVQMGENRAVDIVSYY
ncbi:MAG TPA: carboxypeptidase-like regulatory domain-containing protein, partial [Geomobilimonas sp.]|nr:carboxypeptidase-like regulatory domain-containing protein [Geomobilimonas sp.]